MWRDVIHKISTSSAGLLWVPATCGKWNAGMCAWWICVWVNRYYVLICDSGGVPFNMASSNFQMPTIRAVNGCRITCWIHQTVLRLLWLNGYCVLGRSDGSQFVWEVGGGWVRETGIGKEGAWAWSYWLSSWISLRMVSKILLLGIVWASLRRLFKEASL